MVDFNKAAAQARAKDDARKNGTQLTKQPDEQAVAVNPFAEMTADRDEMAARLAKGELEAAPQIAELPEGVTVHCHLEGNGVPYETTDMATGEVKEVQTWILGSLKTPGMYYSILSTVQLDKKLPPFVGGEVYITKLDERKSSTGRRYRDYHVVGASLPGGRRRDWTGKAQQLALVGSEPK
jgi:hypothetical protein